MTRKRDTTAKKVARFGLLVALSLVLGLMDRAIPLTWFLSGAIPGIKLGLANTVLVYAVYLMDWGSCFLLMLAKVVLSGLIFGSLTAILYSLSGGLLSLLVMLLVRRYPKAGSLGISGLAAASVVMLLIRNPHPSGQMLWCIILIAVACLASLAVFFLLRRHPDFHVISTSLSGAVSHNLGQILMAALVLHTPRLLVTYLPVLVGIGAVVGWLTGVIAQRVMKALHHLP